MVGDRARQSPLGDGDAIRNKDADQQNGNIGEPGLGKIHDGEGKGADELSNRPAPGNPLTKFLDERKLPPHVHEQDEYHRRQLSGRIGNDDHQQAAGRNDADDLAELPDRRPPRLHAHDPSIKSAGAVKRARQIRRAA